MTNLEKAQQAISLVISKAQELNLAISVSIVDSNGIVIAAAKMDNAISISPKFAYAKAHTAAAIGLPTSAIADFAVPGKPYYGITTAFAGELMTIAGGVPIKAGESVWGGIGVGGSLDVANDAICAKAGLTAFAV